jgi:hypothetical protein
MNMHYIKLIYSYTYHHEIYKNKREKSFIIIIPLFYLVSNLNIEKKINILICKLLFLMHFKIIAQNNSNQKIIKLFTYRN